MNCSGTSLTDISESSEDKSAIYRFRSERNEAVGQDCIHLSELNILQRIFLTTDGTLTEMLELYLSEYLHAVKLSESKEAVISDILPLDIRSGRTVIERKILLQGRTSMRNWLYAESLIVPDRLGTRFRDELITSEKPIGKLWRKYKIETFKEIVCYFCEPTGYLSDYFDIKREDCLLCRTYRVSSKGKPIMMITEKFPKTYFILNP